MNVAQSISLTSPLKRQEVRIEAQENELQIQSALNKAWETTLHIQEQNNKAFDISIYGGVAVDLAFNYGVLTQPHQDLDLICFNIPEDDVLEWIKAYLDLESSDECKINKRNSASRKGLTQYSFKDSNGLLHELGLYNGDKQEFIKNGMNYPILIELSGNGLAFNSVGNLSFPTMTLVEKLLNTKIENSELTLCRLVSFIKDLTRWGDETTIKESILKIWQFVINPFNERVRKLPFEEREALKENIFAIFDYHEKRLKLEIDNEGKYSQIQLINRRYKFFQVLMCSGLVEVIFPDRFYNIISSPSEKNKIITDLYRCIAISPGYYIYLILSDELGIDVSQTSIEFAIGKSFRDLFK